jgi:hypothetical protein
VIQLLAVVLAIGLHRAAAAQWREGKDSSDFGAPVPYLTVRSREQNADFWVRCEKRDIGRQLGLVEVGEELDAPRLLVFSLGMDRELGFFDYSGSDYELTLAVRFLPNSKVYHTHWHTRAEHGYPSIADGTTVDTSITRNRNPLQGLDPAGARAAWFEKLTQATTFEVKLHTYGRGNPIATFEIANHDVLERFAADCSH